MCLKGGKRADGPPHEQWQGINRNYVSGGLNLFDAIYIAAVLVHNDRRIQQNHFASWLLW